MTVFCNLNFSDLSITYAKFFAYNTLVCVPRCCNISQGLAFAVKGSQYTCNAVFYNTDRLTRGKLMLIPLYLLTVKPVDVNALSAKKYTV